MIDQSLIKYLDEEAQIRLRAFETMFDTDGWKYSMEFFEYQYNAAKLQALGATSWEDNRLATGKMQILGDILRLQEGTAAEFESMALQAQEAVEEDVIDGELEYE